MKRLLTLMLIGVLAILVMVPVSEAAKLGGGAITFKHQLDSTVATKSRIDTTQYMKLLDSVNSGNRIFLTDIAEHRTAIGGWFLVTYSKFDTNSAGAVPDTTKDTVWVDILTADAGGTPNKVVWSSSKLANLKVTASAANSDYVPFLISPDSSLYGTLYFRVRTNVVDSTAVSLSTGIHYRLAVQLYGSE